MCYHTINDILLPPFIFIIYLIIIWSLFCPIGQKAITQTIGYHNSLPQQNYLTKRYVGRAESALTPERYELSVSDLEEHFSDLEQLVSDYLDSLERVQLYRILLKIHVPLCCRGEPKPLDAIRDEIVSLFGSSPDQVLDALKSI